MPTILSAIWQYAKAVVVAFVKPVEKVSSLSQGALAVLGTLGSSAIVTAIAEQLSGTIMRHIGLHQYLVAPAAFLVAFFLIAPFAAWWAKQRRVDELEGRLTPRFDVGFEPDHEGLFDNTPRPEIFVRGYIQSETDSELEDCRVNITRISVNRNGKWDPLVTFTLPCWWATKHADGVVESVPPRQKYPFNIAYVYQGSPYLHPTSGIAAPGVVTKLTENNTYRFLVSVHAKGAPGKELEIEIDWKSGLAITAKRIFP